MDLFDAIRARRSYLGAYRPGPVPREHLRAIMEAGLAAPSGCNKQTVRLVAVDEDCDAHTALRAARADAHTLYAVYSGSRLIRLTDERRLLEAVIRRDGDARVLDA